MLVLLLLLAFTVFVLNPVIMKAFLCMLRSIISIFSPPISSQDELEKLLKSERVKLGLLDKKIKALLVAPRSLFEADVEKINADFYLIRCARGSTRTSVSHELYHIYDAAAEEYWATRRFIWEIKYLYWWEPRAIFYEFRRLRACNLVLKQAS